MHVGGGTLRALATGSLVVGAVLVTSLAGGSAPAGATGAIDVVTTCAGSGTGSLPAVVAAAASGDTVTFANGLSCPPGSPITVTSTITVSLKGLKIVGPGASSIAVSGGGAVPVFYFGSGEIDAISGLTIENGSSTASCGTFGGSVVGGGITNWGNLSVTDSTITGNTGMGVDNNGVATITNSTISGNSGPGYGDFTSAASGYLVLTDSTLTGNGCGLYGGNDQQAVGGSVIAGNTVDCVFNNSLVTDLGYNLSDDPSCGGIGLLHQATDKTVPGGGVDLGPLRNNGGPTDTFLPGAGSPAFGAIPPGTTLGTTQACPRVDQRGVPSSGNCAIGAVEPFGVSTRSLPNATPGTAYGTVTLSAQGEAASTSPNLTTLKWKKITLPSGMKLTSAGVLSGTPSPKLTAGPSSVTIQLTETITTLSGTKKVKTKTTIQVTIPITLT